MPQYLRRQQVLMAVLCLLVLLAGCDQPASDNSGNDYAAQASVSAAPGGPGEASPPAGSPADHYQQYCALCHGDEREGYANDGAPSLKSSTLFGLGLSPTYMAISYGRPGTPMGPYLDELGGPMSRDQVGALSAWLSSQAGVEPAGHGPGGLTPVTGDVGHGRQLYASHCAQCHGENGEGGGETAPGTALGNATMLATSPDRFLRLAIAEGRADTPMEGFAGRLSDTEIDDVVAFLRSRAQGWDASDLAYSEPPSLDNIVLNPAGQAPEFDLKDGRYVLSEDLNQALEEGRRMVLIDTRVPYFWAMAHIAGSSPVPYYSSGEQFIEALPNDDTWIVAYCECPRAAADSTVNKLRELGFKNTAVLWEGYAGWSALGFPVAVGKITEQIP